MSIRQEPVKWGTVLVILIATFMIVPELVRIYGISTSVVLFIGFMVSDLVDVVIKSFDE